MLKEIISDFREYKIWIREYLQVRRYAIRFTLARHMADMMQKAMNKQISVVLNSNKRFEYWTSDTLKRRKKEGSVPKNWSMYPEVAQVTFYKTGINLQNKTTLEERAEYKAKFIRYAKKYFQ